MFEILAIDILAGKYSLLTNYKMGKNVWVFLQEMILIFILLFIGAIGAFYLATENLHQIPITGRCILRR